MTQPYPSAPQALALHLGSWRGIFRDYEGSSLSLKSQKRSLITFSQPEPGSIHQRNTYLSMEADPNKAEGSNGSGMGWLYRSYAAGLRFFGDGSFSNGRLQLAPFSDFGVEQGFLWQESKARVVQLFDPAGALTTVTTILETRQGLPELDPPRLRPEQLLGSWRGQAVTFEAQEYVPRIDPIQFSLTEMPERVLPGSLWLAGAITLPIPTQHPDRSFEISLGWIPVAKVLRQIIRRYDSTGAWSSVTLIAATSG